MVGVDHVDEGLAEVGQHAEQLVFDLLELAGLDLELPRATVLPEGEELLLSAKVEGEELVDEGDVVIEPPHLEDLLAPLAQLEVPLRLRLEVVALLPLGPKAAHVPAPLEVAEQLDADLVRV